MENLNWVDLFPDYESGLSRIIKAIETGNALLSPPEKPLIYVSYALIDNENGWVTTLKENLASEIAQRIGRWDDRLSNRVEHTRTPVRRGLSFSYDV